MNKATVVTAVAAVAFIASLARVSTAPQAPPPAAQPSVAQGQLATMQQYCVGCHNDRAKVAGVSFEGVTLESIGQHADVFEKAVRKMRGRVMPPPGARHPGCTRTRHLNRACRSCKKSCSAERSSATV